MASVTLKNLPPELHARLKERAAAHGRSLNGEILALLRSAVMAEVVDTDALLASAREARAGIKARLTDAFLDKARRRGRP